MNYEETLHFLFTRLPMFSRIGAAAYKADLTNTITLCNAINNPQNKFKTIHIAGTNGKGSTSHMLAAILQTAGYKTGLYTSPHLVDFRERIKVNGQMCNEEFVVNFTKKIEPIIDAINPSFFEITVAMAFDYFEEQKVDIAIIETGLGGRLDSTNIITPILSVITNIGYDHMNLLGNTLDKIAFEKAGIIKSNIPVIIGEVINETKFVFENKANEVVAPIVYATQQNLVTNWLYQHHLLQVTVENNQTKKQHDYSLDLNGIYQTKNLITILAAVDYLQKNSWHITQQHIEQALKHVKQLTGLHGRWEVLQNNPTIIADVAHNADGIKQIIQQLEITNYNHLHIVIGMVKDKDVEAVIKLLPKLATYYFTQAKIERAMDATDVQTISATYSLQGKTYLDVNIAIAAAQKNAHKNDLILICGSIFLIGEVRV